MFQINTFILVATVRSMIKSRRKFVGTKDSKSWRLALYDPLYTSVKHKFLKDVG